MTTIEINSLTKRFDARGLDTVIAVSDIDITIESGEFFTIVGPSGCGKTTTLRCIAGLEKPTSGSIKFDGVDVVDVPASKRKLAMMFQNIALYPHMKIIDNIAFPLMVKHVSEEERKERATEAAEVMQIPDLLDKYPGEISGGQRQRAALARTLVQDPTAFLMDEPLSDLDAKLKVEMRKEIQRVHKRVDTTTVYVTHDQEEAMTMSDRIAVMMDGTVEQVGEPDELYHYPVNRSVAEFIGLPQMNFLDGSILDIAESSLHLEIEDSNVEIQVDMLQDSISREDVQIGVRPEGLSIAPKPDSSGLSGEVILLERIGDRLLATLQGQEWEVEATLSEATVSEGDVASLDLTGSEIFVFDSNSGGLVAKGIGR